VGKVTTTVLPFDRLPPVNLASSDVTVCAIPLLFTQHTDCPAVIVAVLGLNVKEPVALMVALAPRSPYNSPEACRHYLRHRSCLSSCHTT
jgi:hypothetical protein